MKISLDTETTGLDLHHGAKPYLITTCQLGEASSYWEWDVNPETREPDVDEDDLQEILDEIRKADKVVLHNTKFDVRALGAIDPDIARNWDWGKTDDTLIMAHLIRSDEPKDLTTLTLKYLGEDVEPYDNALREATMKARRLAKSHLPSWARAEAGRVDMPSAKEKVWKFDAWMPRAICKWARAEKRRQRKELKDLEKLPDRKREKALKGLWWLEYTDPKHEWNTVCSQYANSDSAATIALSEVLSGIIAERRLGRIYSTRMDALRVTYLMECNGVTLSEQNMREKQEEFKRVSDQLDATCEEIHTEMGYPFSLPKAGTNNAMYEFCTSRRGLDLERFFGYGSTSKAYTPTGKLSLSSDVLKSCLALWEASEDGETSKGEEWIQSLLKKRQLDTAMNYMSGYQRFWLPLTEQPTRVTDSTHDADRRSTPGWFILYPSFNPTGTGTLRFTSSNPNAQNISKQDEVTLRTLFGPAPGRIWYSLDYENIELRIPTYESEEESLIDLFENADEPPYYGSNHLLNFSIIYPELWAEVEKEVGIEQVGPECKKRYKATWYQWCKNFGFAVQYGASPASGTADAAAHRQGAQAKLMNRLTKLTKLNYKMLGQANKTGYVETMPDKTVDPERGYPLYCTTDFWGRVKPTVPLNYHVQGTAMWCTMKAMIRVQNYLDELNWGEGYEAYRIIMQVHDEIVLDFPDDNLKNNRRIIRKVQKLMEQSGDDIGIPLKVSVGMHPLNWGKEEKL